ncbi:SIMPL domain-containing protein [Aurantiacibacter poecillastricola]|uniref:SIMPL domain-containing protein n=1 Tax=Aurantiacibacter poecillastricola TaxID=3064385 RepID=UPI00273D471E|nr:SIMPL domain-containing protein [Aurantiacibacter sp. 219JJ12-13]MDP5262672.1 SIMPL domain-containing protein [Aurantiacibacter sp. 219JJ12-13]
MKRLAISTLAAAMIATPAAANVEITASGPVIALSVNESVALDPDIANLSAGVTVIAPTAVEAMRRNAVEMRGVIERIEALGIDEDDIQTTGVNLNPEYDYNQQTREQEFRGYRVSNRVSVKLRDIQRTGEVLDALVAAGATDIGGIGWGVDDTAPAIEQARQAAFATAHQRARDYAQLSGYGDIRLLEISESVSSNIPMPMMRQVATVDVAEESTPVRPGQVEAGLTVNFSFEMVE